ncbi:MAG: M15 family metallopeptidase [Paracoccus sp. (in: a-proteobacteria)]|uniref:M15 family metallopeptidase n=1 Tax=Paracoccus sp. TaxID=267 RepID=UPI0026DFF1F7|nr:M15 family metallopeptidase [Paracoccus sp. (in: a-proteobacteria)]MDO5631358.1 M15 family metallopeptidase [Paracoccus sp. (in: a-proteobacteria)]
MAGRLRTPQAIYRAALAENPDPSGADRVFDLPPDPVWTAPARLRAPGHFLSNTYLRQLDRADWAFVDPRLQYWAALFQEYARKRGVPLYVHSALRDKATQEKAFSEGRSKAIYGRSAHNIGEAVDIVHGVYHWNLTENEWRVIHMLGMAALDRVNAQLPKDRKLRLTWGGEFKSLYDPAHWEIMDYRQRLRPMPKTETIRRTPRWILRHKKP